VYGDSGVGKSSFIKALGGVDVTGEQPQTGGAGEAMTKSPGKIYLIDVTYNAHN
jgi:GTPase SAR1 family protein